MEIKKERYTFVTKCEYYRTSHNWYYVLWYDGKDKPARPVSLSPLGVTTFPRLRFTLRLCGIS